MKGKAKYRLIDEQVRYFVAPPVEEIEQSPVRANVVSVQYVATILDDRQLKAYVSQAVRLTNAQKREVYGKLPQGGLRGETLLKLAESSLPEVAAPSSASP